MAEEKIKLALDYGESKKDTIDVASALDKVKTAAKGVGADAFAELIGKSSELITKLKETAKETLESGAKTKLGLAEIAQAAGGLFNAFSTGNIGGAIKGISGLVALVPALNTFAPAIQKAGEMADIAWPILKEWYEYLDKANKGIIESTRDINEYAAALRASNAVMKETEALAKAKADDAADKAAPSKKAKDRGEIFSDLTKGRQAETMKEVFDAVHADREDERDDQVEAIKKRAAKSLKEYTDRSGDTSGPIYKGFRATYDAQAKADIAKVQSGAGDQAIAEELLKKARAGDAAALKKLRDVLPEGSTTAEVSRMASPEAQDEARADKRDAADQQKRFAERGTQRAEKEAANRTVQEQIKHDIARQEAKMIERSVSSARGREGHDADIEATKKFFEGGQSMRGAGMVRPGGPNAAQQETNLNRLRAGAIRKSRRREPTPRHGYPTSQQERSAPGQSNQQIMGAMEAIVANQTSAAGNDAQRIQQILMAARNAGTQLAANRSFGSNGTI